MNRHLVLFDFDGTLADTFDDSPNGWNVEKASRTAVEEIFGEKGLQVYDESGGLRNMAPIELVGNIQRTLGQSVDSKVEITKRFVDIKLSYLVPEISSDWPRFYPGVDHFLRKAAGDGYWADVGILSSGHDRFIRRVLDVNGIGSRDIILVTSDVYMERPFPKRDKFKPHPYQVAEAHHRWLHRQGFYPLGEQNYLGRSFGKPYMLFVGDDPVKDGGLAEASRIPFIQVPFTKPGFVPDSGRGQMVVKDFEELDDILDYQHGDQLGRGWSFAKALFGREDEELFPPLPDGEVYRRVLKERSFV